jgi:hypothetical protein
MLQPIRGDFEAELLGLVDEHALMPFQAPSTLHSNQRHAQIVELRRIVRLSSTHTAIAGLLKLQRFGSCGNPYVLTRTAGFVVSNESLFIRRT